MDNQTIWEIAIQQSAYDCSCAPEDFLSAQNSVHESKASEKARKYLKLPHICNLVSYGANIVATGRVDLLPEIARFLDGTPGIENCFETPGIYPLNRILEKAGARVCFMADYFLPDIDEIYQTAIAVRMSCGYWNRRILRNCICRNGKTRCAKTGRRWTAWQWALMIKGNWWGWRAVLRTATRCGRLAWMSLQRTGGRGLRRRLPTGWPGKRLREGVCRFTVRHGLM